MSPVKLSDGTVIQTGKTIAMPSDPMAHDKAYYNKPYEFDGNRFLGTDAHDADTQQAESAYSAIEPGNLSWGHGRFSCPGRWYASAMMKLLLATLLLDYDFHFPEGQSIRPPNFVMDLHVLPDMKQKIIVQRRQSGVSSKGPVV